MYMNNEKDSEFLDQSNESENNSLQEMSEVPLETSGAEQVDGNVSESADEPKKIDSTADSEGVGSEDRSCDSSEGITVVKTIFEYLELFVTSICVVILIFMFCLRLCDVNGASMKQTLYNGEKLLISNLFYIPERGDIIVFHNTTGVIGEVLNEPVVKRVIATGGETVVLDYQTYPQSIIVTIYGDENMTEVLDESTYAYYDGTNRSAYDREDEVYHVPEGYLFVMGDNRNNSTDSRSIEIGFVDERRVLGHVFMRIYPFSEIGAVD